MPENLQSLEQQEIWVRDLAKHFSGGWRTRTESIQKLILLTWKEVTDFFFFFKPSTQLLFEPQAIKLIRTLVLLLSLKYVVFLITSTWGEKKITRDSISVDQILVQLVI